MNQGGEPAAVLMTSVSSLSVRASERSPLSRATWVASLAIDALSVTLADARAEPSIRFASWKSSSASQMFAATRPPNQSRPTWSRADLSRIDPGSSSSMRKARRSRGMPAA